GHGLELVALAQALEGRVPRALAREAEAGRLEPLRRRVRRGGVVRVDRAEEAVDAHPRPRPREQVALVVAGIGDLGQLVEAALPPERGAPPGGEPLLDPAV